MKIKSQNGLEKTDKSKNERKPVKYYKVKKGDSLFHYSENNSTTVEELLKLNNMKINDPLLYGLRIKIPLKVITEHPMKKIIKITLNKMITIIFCLIFTMSANASGFIFNWESFVVDKDLFLGNPDKERLYQKFSCFRSRNSGSLRNTMIKFPCMTNSNPSQQKKQTKNLY